MVRMLAISLVCFSLPACLAIRDADDFQEDPACDLSLPLRNFLAHGGQNAQRTERQRFTIRTVRETIAGSDINRTREAVMVFDPLPGPDVDVFIPRVGIPAQLTEQRPLSLEFFADLNRNGALDMPDDDHSWLEPHLCTASGVPFVHNTDFLELEVARTQPNNLHILPLPAQVDEWRSAIEVRVARATPLGGTEEVTRAFYRRAPWDFQREQVGDEEIPSEVEQAKIVLPGILRDSEDSFITIFVDRDADGVFDDNEDFVVTRTVDPGGNCRGASVCNLRGNTIEIGLSLLEANGDQRTSNGVTLEPWWSIPQL